MNEVLLHPGDAVIVNGARITLDRAATVTSDSPVHRMPAPGMRDLPETGLQIHKLWKRDGHRVPMVTREDLRCPCGPAYVRRSETHHSCHYCGRVWENARVDGKP